MWVSSSKDDVHSIIQQDAAGTVKDRTSGQATASNENTVQQLIEPPPDGGYGWVCTVAVAVINMHSWGFSSAYSVFLAHYLSANSFPGTSALEYAFVGGVSLACLFIVSPIATICVGRFGIRPTMFAGMLLETAGMICASFASRIWHLFLTQGVLFGLGLGLLFIPTAAVVPQWFSKKRSLASGVSLAGAAFGGTAYSLAAGAMIRNIGLHWALRTLGILAFAANTSMILLVRDHSKAIGSTNAPFDRKHFKSAGYWLLLGFGGLTMLGYFILIFTLANFANNLGLNASQAAIVSAMFNLGQTIGRPLAGYFSDTLGRINMAGSLTFIAGVLPLAWWVGTTTYGTLVAFALLEGIVAGTFWATIAPLMIEVVGMKDVSSGLTPMWLSLAIPCTFSEAIALIIVKQTRSYLGTQLFTGFMYIAAAVCMFFIRGWKIDKSRMQHARDEGASTEGSTSPTRDQKRHMEASEMRSGFFGTALRTFRQCFKLCKV